MSFRLRIGNWNQIIDLNSNWSFCKENKFWQLFRVDQKVLSLSNYKARTRMTSVQFFLFSQFWATLTKLEWKVIDSHLKVACMVDIKLFFYGLILL